MGENAPQFWEWWAFLKFYGCLTKKHRQFILDQQISTNSLFLMLGVLFQDETSFLTCSFLTKSLHFNKLYYCLEHIDSSAPHTRGWIFQSSSQIPLYIGMVETGITQKKNSTPTDPIRSCHSNWILQSVPRYPVHKLLIYCGVVFHDAHAYHQTGRLWALTA